MSKVLIFKTATTGLPIYAKPSEDPEQPHLVQLAALLCDESSGKIIQKMSVIIKPDGWDIPEVTVKSHGITEEMAHKQGIPEKEALDAFLEMRADFKRSAYVRAFDQRIIRIATKRYCTEEQIDKWAVKDDFECIMAMAKPFTKIPLKSGKGFKGPKMDEAYAHFFGRPADGSISTEVGAKTCMDVYFAAKNSV